MIRSPQVDPARAGTVQGLAHVVQGNQDSTAIGALAPVPWITPGTEGMVPLATTRSFQPGPRHTGFVQDAAHVALHPRATASTGFIHPSIAVSRPIVGQHAGLMRVGYQVAPPGRTGRTTV